MEIRFESRKRPVVAARLNGKEYHFLLDTGASVGLIDKGVRGLHPSARKVRIVDASGDEIRCPVLGDTVEIGGKRITQFIASDLSGVRSSIQRETGLRIDGIIGYGQMQAIGAVMDTSKGTLTI